MEERKKTMSMKTSFLLMGVVLIAMNIGAIVSITYAHEQVHQQIYKKYGIDSRIDMNLFNGWIPNFNGEATTTALGNYSNCDDTCKLAQLQNEIFGYQFMAFSVTFFVSLSIIKLILYAILLNLGGNDET